jgi:hypothetical protein
MTNREAHEMLDFFPLVEPPITLSPDNITEISKVNKPLPQDFQHYILENWEEHFDEFSEIIPCLQMPREEEYFSLIYWKANLLSHEYVLVTLDTRSFEILSRKIIAGVKSDGERVIQSVANISEDNTIQVMIGEMKPNTTIFDPMTSSAISMEILPGGNIYSQKEEEPLAWVEKNRSKKQE